MRRLLAAAVAALVISSVTGCFAPAPEPGQDGEHRLRIGLPSPPRRQMSPYTDDALRGTQVGASETLVHLDAAGGVVPGLARDWSRIDPSTVRVTLRRGVVFHDGTPLTAAHAAAALTHAVAARPVLRALVGVNLTARAVDDELLELRTDRPDPVLLHRLTSPQLAILGPKAYQRDPGTPDPIGAGTGPYRIVSVQDTSGMTLDRNDAYWGGRPRLAGVDVRFLPDGPARVGALRSGEMDLVSEVPAGQLPTLDHGRLIEVPLPRTVSLYLIGAAGRPFADPGLRAAARTATDPALIARSVYEGRVDPAVGLFGPASEWAAAGRAAASAAAPAVAAPTPAAGRRITLATYTRRPELPEVASALAAALSGQGFEVETIVGDYSTMEPDIMAGRYDALVLSRSYLLEVSDPIAYLVSDFSCRGSFNLTRFCDRDFDARVAAADRLGDLPARHAAALALEAELVNRAVVVPLIHERTRIAIGDDVSGLAADPYERRLVTVETSLG